MKATVLGYITYVASILFLMASSFCLYALHRVVDAIRVTDPDFYTTSGTVLASRLTVAVLIVVFALSLVYVRRGPFLQQMALFNTIAGVLILVLTMFAAATQILMVLPMNS